MKQLTLFLSALILNITLIGQSKKNRICYRETLGENAKIFTKSLYYPRYKDGDNELGIFLADNINLSIITKSVMDTVRLIEDSIKVKFVISKKGEMSDVFINSKWEVLSFEIKNALIKSSCNWIPGGTERYLPVWFNGVIYFRLEKAKNSFQLMISTSSRNS